MVWSSVEGVLVGPSKRQGTQILDVTSLCRIPPLYFRSHWCTRFWVLCINASEWSWNAQPLLCCVPFWWAYGLNGSFTRLHGRFWRSKAWIFDRVLLILALFREAGEGGRTQHRTTNRKKESFTADSLNYKTQPVTGVESVTKSHRIGEPNPYLSISSSSTMAVSRFEMITVNRLQWHRYTNELLECL